MSQVVQLFALVLLSAVGQMLLPSFLAQMISHGVAEGKNRVIWMYAIIMAEVTITTGNQRSMHVHKTSLLEKLMNRISSQRTHTKYSLECICSRTKMRNRSKIFKTMTLLLQRIIRR